VVHTLFGFDNTLNGGWHACQHWRLGAIIPAGQRENGRDALVGSANGAKYFSPDPTGWGRITTSVPAPQRGGIKIMPQLFFHDHAAVNRIPPKRQTEHMKKRLQEEALELSRSVEFFEYQLGHDG
jgi:hypothetical protein